VGRPALPRNRTHPPCRHVLSKRPDPRQHCCVKDHVNNGADPCRDGLAALAAFGRQARLVSTLGSRIGTPWSRTRVIYRIFGGGKKGSSILPLEVKQSESLQH